MNQEKFDKIVETFKNATDGDGRNLNMHYLLIKDRDNCFVHSFNNRAGMSDIRSISKTVMTFTMGYDKILLMRDDMKNMNSYDYVDFIINYPITYKAGEHYLYSNAGFYLLSAVLQEFLQEDL